METEIIAFISRYINTERNDVGRLIEYIESHETIKSDVFRYAANKSGVFMLDTPYSRKLDSDGGFQPVKRDAFIRRIPFYYYEEQMSNSTVSPLDRYLPLIRDNEADIEGLERLYKGMELMFYDLNISLEDIFNYPFFQLYETDQNSRPYKDENGNTVIPESIARNLFSRFLNDEGLSLKELMLEWIHYLELCRELNWLDYMPDRLITKYNLALEESGLDPIIYMPLKQEGSGYMVREAGNVYTCYGNFPCDDDGQLIMKWCGVELDQPGQITYSGKRSGRGKLTIELTPSTKISVKGVGYSDEYDGDTGFTIYAGPLTMEFDYETLKRYRLQRNMTQSQVAGAIGAHLRTYQKWENGETTPDGLYMLRLMNWLDIDNPQELVKYDK